MKQGKVILFDIIVGIVVCLMCISFSAKDMIVQTVNEGAIGHAVAIRIMDVVDEAFPDIFLCFPDAYGTSTAQAAKSCSAKTQNRLQTAYWNNVLCQRADPQASQLPR